MKAQVPYLTRLARQGAAPPTLRPPRPLFTGANHPQPLEPVSGERTAGPADAGPARSRPRPLPRRGHDPVDAPGALTAASAPDAEALMPRASRTPSPAALEAPARVATSGTSGSSSTSGTSGTQAVRREADPPSLARSGHDGEPAGQEATAGGPSSAGPSSLGGPSLAGPSPAGPSLAGPSLAGPSPAGPSLAGPSPVASGPGTAGPPESWNDPVWGRPVELPAIVPQLPSPGHAGGQRPAGVMAGSDELPWRPAHPRSAPRSGGPRQAQVSIGTIEVTVVPAAKPSGAEIPPAKPVIRSRPPALIATGPGADRMRDGRRRWYGIAQG
jgi:hypothetical protein